MNKFVYCALATSMAGGLSFAGSESEEWSTLDRDIENLASSVAPQDMGLAFNGFVRSIFDYSSDIQVAGNDLSGFRVENVRLEASGSAGDYGFFVQLDAGERTNGTAGGPGALQEARLLDAYGSFAIGEQVWGRMGQFRTPFLWSSWLEEDSLLFNSRSFNGRIWNTRDQGVMLGGDFSQLGWYVALQNGVDGQGDDLAFSAKVDFDAMGTGAGQVQGAYGADEGTNLSLGLAYYDDAGLTDGAAIGFDAQLIVQAFSLYAEVVDYDTGFAGVGDSTPFAIWGGFMISPDSWELAARFQDLDDAFDTRAFTLGVNKYMQGHAAKWILDWTTTDSDSNALNVDVVSVGFVVSV